MIRILPSTGKVKGRYKVQIVQKKNRKILHSAEVLNTRTNVYKNLNATIQAILDGELEDLTIYGKKNFGKVSAKHKEAIAKMKPQ